MPEQGQKRMIRRSTSGNGKREKLIEFCIQHGLRILYGYYQHINIHRYIWTRPKSIIDYIIIKQSNRFKWLSAKINRGAKCGSNHQLMRSELVLQYHKSTKADDITENITMKNLERFNVN